ncbi:serine/threonine-protein kinase [Streptosporangium sp. NPDC004379]|uniref:serine/threonine-protein kinase n=1 Tax=Streptosporangium sp. NPDC004379 TaxID=3366189 RepID=UPI0036ABEA0F
MGDNASHEPRFTASEVAHALGEDVTFLGRGAYGDTWRSGNTAVKIICSDDYPEARLKREVEGLSRASSPRVVALLETTVVHLRGANRPALRFEYIAGGDLASLVSQGKWPNPLEAEGLLRGLLEGADALHQARTIHRDIKPGNIALRNGDWTQPVLLDLGLAKQLDGSTITAYPGHIGTYTYMAPEQLQGQRARKAADLWAIGVTVRQMVCQRHPFYHDGESLTIDQAITRMSQGPISLPEGTSEPVQSVLDRLTAVPEYERGSTGSNLRRLGFKR